MRLRQAHAILEAATALHTAGLGFEIYPFDHEAGDSSVTDDFVTGAAYLPPGSGERVYNVTIRPHADSQTVTAYVDFDIEPGGPLLLNATFDVTAPDEEGVQFRGLVGARIAEQIANAVRAHEQRYDTDLRGQ